MDSSWRTETGHLACRWSEAGKCTQYKPRWLQQTMEAQRSYLPPPPDFASRSPFGGPSWFPHCTVWPDLIR